MIEETGQVVNKSKVINMERDNFHRLKGVS